MNNKKSKFKGFELADKPFANKSENCSKCIKDSCGSRDCLLQVYKLGNEQIVAGGLCPKGNTNVFDRKAPNYVQEYNNKLNEWLKKYTIGDEKVNNKDGKARVLIPRSLIFLNEKGIFFAALYNKLGFDVYISPESNEEIAELGRKYAHSECCFPVILAHGHAAFLKKKIRRGVDKMLLVSAIGSGPRPYLFCPYIGSSGYVIKGNINLDDSDLLIPTIYFDNEHYKIEKAVQKDLKRAIKYRSFGRREVKKAVEFALGAQKEFLKEIYARGKTIIQEITSRKEPLYIGIGRGYTLLDNKASSKVHELFSNNGLHFLPTLFMETAKEYDENLAENMYWFQGRKMLLDMKTVSNTDYLFPVRETNFNCGPDSILLYHEESIIEKNGNGKPNLVLETDGHNSNAQFGTRILANKEVVQKYINKKKIMQNAKQNKIENYNHPLKESLLGIPYMGETSFIAAAIFNAFGIKAEVMPTRTKESINYAHKLVQTNTCQPFAFQVGDHFAWLNSLKERGIDANKEATVLLPKADGPCRFGQYAIVLRKLFDEHGLSGVQIISPTVEDGYASFELDKKTSRQIIALLFSAGFANDVLLNAMMRIRPYEINKGESDSVFKKAHKELIELTYKKPGVGEIERFLKEKVKDFEAIKRIENERFPLVLINGEIFIRCHEVANQESARLLEKYKIEVMLEPMTGWLDYINVLNVRRNWREGKYIKLKNELISNLYMGYVKRKLFAPFKELLKGREFHNPYSFIDAAQKDLIYNEAISGESPITIGQAYALVNGKLHYDGIYHVGPLGCMQETAATSRIQSIIQEKRKNAVKEEDRIIPFMDAVFAESELANLDSLVALFAKNCYSRRQLHNK